MSAGKAERLELAGDHARHLAVSSDGRALAVSPAGNDADIWRFRSAGVDDFLWSTLDERNAQFSPNGKRIAFESRRLGFDTQIWLANADGTNTAPLTEGLKGIGGSPRWSPDSRRIVFDALDADGQRAVYVVDAEGGRASLFVKPGLLPSWSQDGQWIYFNDSSLTNRTGRQEVWRKPVSGGTEVQVTEGGNPLESPDGTMLYYRKFFLPGCTLRLARGRRSRTPCARYDVAGPLHEFYPADDGVDDVSAPDPKAPFAREIRLHFDDKQTRNALPIRITRERRARRLTRLEDDLVDRRHQTRSRRRPHADSKLSVADGNNSMGPSPSTRVDWDCWRMNRGGLSSATSRLSLVSRARNTSPIPPTPMLPMTS